MAYGNLQEEEWWVEVLEPRDQEAVFGNGVPEKRLKESEPTSVLDYLSPNSSADTAALSDPNPTLLRPPGPGTAPSGEVAADELGGAFLPASAAEPGANMGVFGLEFVGSSLNGTSNPVFYREPEPAFRNPPRSSHFYDSTAAAAHQKALVEHLLKAAALVEAGDFVDARVILARLNHHLPFPIGTPLARSCFYFKEALFLLITNGINPPPLRLSSLHDVLLKLRAFKAFSDMSPVLHFTNFTCIQALLDALGGAARIHVVDFDIELGGRWSAFMEELAQRRSAGTLLLKITAVVLPWSHHHPPELHLAGENLSHLAAGLNIPFEFNVINLDAFDPSLILTIPSGVDEAIAVNIPVRAMAYPPGATLLRLLKQISPKIVVSVDHGFDRGDLPFSHHFFHAFQTCAVLLDSIDAAGTATDGASKIERFLMQPRIESAVLGHHRVREKMPHWRMLLASSGFMPVEFSNFAVAQAECLLKRVQVRGFGVKKHQSTLALCWQQADLISVSAWSC
ncbi:scarecrow-like protein 6 [Typha angustifolia]|uniref:scarecrow-like protein 6 n=1 Tax=Typha angustifolia TaxID=59011 RepID=UPI003C2DA06A